MSQMDVRKLKNFLAVVELRSISRAADALHIAQPALSVQVQQLEESAGCQLLSRSSRGVEPTEAGLEFCRRATAVLKQLQSLQSLGSEMAAAPSGHVVVGMPVSVGTLLSVPLVQQARERYPAITLGIDESPSVQLGELLLRGRLDVAVLFGDAVSKGLQASMLVDETLYAVGVPGSSGEITLRQLAERPLLMPARPNSLRGVLEQACEAQGLQLQVAVEVSSPHTIVQLARAGLGVAVLPWSTLAGTAEAELPRARIVEPELQRSIAVCVATDAPQSPALIAVRRLLAEEMRALVASGRWQGARCRCEAAD